MNNLTKRILIALFSIPVFIFVFVTAALILVHISNGVEFSYENNGTDLSFCSSDGIWKMEEDILNGKNFEKILLEVESLKFIYYVQRHRKNLGIGLGGLITMILPNGVSHTFTKMIGYKKQLWFVLKENIRWQRLNSLKKTSKICSRH